MISLETFGGAEGARTIGNIVMGHGGLTRRFGFGVGGFILDSFNAHVCQGEIEIVEARV